MTIKTQLATFIQDTLASGVRDLHIDDETRLIERGLIDSIGLMELVQFIEGETGVRVPDDEVHPDNFQTVATMDAMIQRLRDQPNRPSASSS
jgi:acyl carrier protein